MTSTHPSPVRAPVALIPALLISFALCALFIYFIILVIRALRKYLRSGQEPKPWERWRYRQDNTDVPQESRSLGEALKAHRTSRNLTQEYVAEALGVSRQAVSKWENGTSDPSTANLMALAKLYGLSVDELLQQVKTTE